MMSLRLPIILVVALACPALRSATSVSQYGITWFFDGDYIVGQYVMGDWYVVDPGGGVRVTSVSPAPSGGRHGSQINPSSVGAQALDSRVGLYSASAGVSYPVTLTAGQSLVSCESIITYPYTDSWAGVTYTSTGHGKIKTAAILTCVSAPPPSLAFRPPYVGASKPVRLVSELNWGFLPAPLSLHGTNAAISYHERGVQRPWLVWLFDYQCRELHPVENMRNYHRDIGNFLSSASLAALTTDSTDALRHGLVQIGIDHYHASLIGEHDSAFWEWPVIFAGLALGDEDIRDVFVDGRAVSKSRAREMLYYVTAKTSPHSSSIVPAGQIWSGWQPPVAFRKNDGDGEHEHLHPTEWTGRVEPPDKTTRPESYRQSADSIQHVGMALAARLCNGMDYVAWPALFDYVDRWMLEEWDANFLPIVQATFPGVASSAQSAGGTFQNAMWTHYRDFAPSPDTTLPTIQITNPTTSPTMSTVMATLEISGTASDAVGIAFVGWSSSRGGGGYATGTTSWSFTVSLEDGLNLVEVEAHDAAGNVGVDSILIDYTPSSPSAGGNATVNVITLHTLTCPP